MHGAYVWIERKAAPNSGLARDTNPTAVVVRVERTFQVMAQEGPYRSDRRS